MHQSLLLRSPVNSIFCEVGFRLSSQDVVPDTVPVSPGKLGDVAFCIQVKNSYCFSYVTCFNPEVEQDEGRLMPNVKDEPMDNFPPTV